MHLSRNHSDLSQKVARLIIKEIVKEGGFNPKIVAHIVNLTDLEADFLGENVNSIVRRIKSLEKDFPQFKA